MPALRILWDSCCFIAVLKKEQKHLRTLLQTLEDAKDGSTELIVSTMAISETVRPPGQRVIPRADSEKQVRDFFENPYIKVRSHDRHIAELGRQLCWDHNLKARDAIHVATAIDTGCTALETTDQRLIDRIGSSIPGLVVRLPVGTGQLTFQTFDSTRETRG